MSGTYSIGELASAAGVPASTIRHYEREGLLSPDGRTDANYRVYGRRSLERLRFIRTAQASGLTLEDVRALFALREGNAAPCREVQELLRRRLEQTEKRLVDLRRVRAVLRSSLEVCHEAETRGRCQVLERLDRGASEQPTVALRGRPKKP